MMKKISFIVLVSMFLNPVLAQDVKEEKQPLCDSTKAILSSIVSLPLLAIGAVCVYYTKKNLKMHAYHKYQFQIIEDETPEPLDGEEPIIHKTISDHDKTLIGVKFGLPAAIAFIAGIACLGTGIYYGVKDAKAVAKLKEGFNENQKAEIIQ